MLRRSYLFLLIGLLMTAQAPVSAHKEQSPDKESRFWTIYFIGMGTIILTRIAIGLYPVYKNWSDARIELRKLESAEGFDALSPDQKKDRVYRLLRARGYSNEEANSMFRTHENIECILGLPLKNRPPIRWTPTGLADSIEKDWKDSPFWLSKGLKELQGEVAELKQIVRAYQKTMSS